MKKGLTDRQLLIWLAILFIFIMGGALHILDENRYLLNRIRTIEIQNNELLDYYNAQQLKIEELENDTTDVDSIKLIKNI